VGVERRARLLASEMTDVVDVKSDRGYVTLTGNYKGYRISIISIGMVYPIHELKHQTEPL
jgi:uridine phosphorylase